jgi:hypothetical protein
MTKKIVVSLAVSPFSLHCTLHCCANSLDSAPDGDLLDPGSPHAQGTLIFRGSRAAEWQCSGGGRL